MRSYAIPIVKTSFFFISIFLLTYSSERQLAHHCWIALFIGLHCAADASKVRRSRKLHQLGSRDFSLDLGMSMSRIWVGF